jgi:glycosyltransferase involved in cell wall biosynthesis
MRILMVTDAWFPQVNGVVRTFATVKREVERMGHAVQVVSPDQFATLPCPGYPEIRLAVAPGRKLAAMLTQARPDAIQIVTEGPLGLAARNICVRRGLPFTTSFDTRFPEYLQVRTRIPAAWTYPLMRWFHRPSRAVMAATPRLKTELEGRGFRNVVLWGRGVDTELFHPRPRGGDEWKRPLMLYAGRVAVEKNLQDFLDLKRPGTKLVVGGGPQLAALKRRYPDAAFLGPREGEALAALYAAADVFVFPSRTDTFGLVLLEALACGTPVAAYPVTGPIDVVGNAPVGALDEDLERAVQRALVIPRDNCREFAERFSWDVSARQFLRNLHPIHRPSPARGRIPPRAA